MHATVDRPAWEMDGGLGTPGGTTGTILLQALLFDDTVDDRVARIPFEFSATARGDGVFETPEDATPGESILDQLLVSQSRMSCLASGPDGRAAVARAAAAAISADSLEAWLAAWADGWSLA